MKKIAILGTIALVAILLNACEKDNTSPEIKISKPVFNPVKTYGTMTDQEGNRYLTITIGTQTWMAENLRTTTYRDGTPIPEVRGNQEWNSSKSGAFCNYGNTDMEDTISVYGRLYNWHVVSDSRKIAPEGWHVPTHDEWLQLFDNLGGWLDAGGKLREAGTTHWLSPNEGADNSSGFTGLPGGMRTGDPFNGVGDAQFGAVGESGWWWSSSEGDIDWEARSVLLFSFDKSAGWGGGGFKECGLSIRCVKD